MESHPRWLPVFLFAIVAASLSAQDWQAEHDRLRAKLEKELSEPWSSSKYNLRDPAPYVAWMVTKAADRAKAAELTARAHNAQNPYWENKFIGLQDLAQESGNNTVYNGGNTIMSLADKAGGRPGDGWQSAIFKAGPQLGQILYNGAVSNGFDKEIIVGFARCLVRFANADLELNWLYQDREEQYNQTSEDFDVRCSPRGSASTSSEGEPAIPADKALEMCEEIRATANLYSLSPERQDTTDIMEEYLKHKKVLCLLPSGRGHGFFLDLAKKYKLDKAKEHIEGFYATLKGKVEIEDEGRKEPAAGAKVTVTDSKDGRTWTATADQDGKYEIQKAILHKNCSPFEIDGEAEGYSTNDAYQGPLEEPDKSKEHEKNLLIQPAAWEGTLVYRWENTAQKGKSLATAVLPGGDYRATESWRLWVKFKKDRANQNVEIYALSSARLETFASDLEATAMDLQNEGRRIEIEVADSASSRSRKLSPEECSLELVLNLKKKTYTLHGTIDVEDIEGGMKSSVELSNTPANYRDAESERAKADIKETINLEGNLAAVPPTLIKGQKDLFEELPPDMKKFLQTLGGEIKTWLSWNIKKSEKK